MISIYLGFHWIQTSSFLKQNELTNEGFDFSNIDPEILEAALDRSADEEWFEISAELLAQRRKHHSLKTGGFTVGDEVVFSKKDLDEAKKQLNKLVSKENSDTSNNNSKRLRSNAFRKDIDALRDLNSGNEPNIQVSATGRVLSVTGRFDLSNFGDTNIGNSFGRGAAHFVESHSTVFGVGTETDIVSPSENQQGPSGEQIVRLQKSYKDLPVWDQAIIVSILDGYITSVSGSLHGIEKNIDTNTKLAEIDLKRAVSDHLETKTTDFKSFSSERGILRYAGIDHYAYKASVEISPTSVWDVFVDPFTSKIITATSLVMQQSTPSSGEDLLGNQRSFRSFKNGESYLLVDDVSESTQIKIGTYPANSEGSLPVVSSSQPNSGWDPAGVSAFVNAELSYKYFSETHGRNSFDNKGSDLVQLVNYEQEQGTCYDNAFWNGTMVYGTGCLPTYRNWAAATDVAVHELAHGVVQHTSGLRYSNQSGALNESFADVFGVLATDTTDWLLGSDAYVTPGRFIRSLSNPPSNGRQPGHMDNFQHLANTPETDHGGVHINSGIPNRAMYLLAEGLTTEELGASIGRNKTEKIAYSALLKLSAIAEFEDSANQMVIEAGLLYGANSQEQESVRKAWAEVGIVTSALELTSNQRKEESGGSLDIDPAQGDSVMTYLRSQDGTTSDDSGEDYDVYLYTINQPYEGFLEGENIGPVNDSPAGYIRPSIATREDGSTLIAYIGKDGIARLTLPNTEDNKIEGGAANQVRSIALSRDGLKYAFVPENSATIWVYDFTSQEWTDYEIMEPNYSEDEPGTRVQLVDSISFDPHGKAILFDYKVCRVVPAESCVDLWSIGEVNLNTKVIDFPFLTLDPLLDLAYPQYSKVGYSAITFDLVDYSDFESEGTVQSFVVVLSSNVTPIVSPNQGDTRLFAYGIPSFIGADKAVLFQVLNDDQSTLYQAEIDDEYQLISDSYKSLLPFTAAKGQAHINAYQNMTAKLEIDRSSHNYANIEVGIAKTTTFTVTNTGFKGIDITSVSTNSAALKTTLTNTLLWPGEEKSFDVTLNASSLTSGTHTSSLTIEHDGDNPTINIGVSANVTDQLKIPEAPKNVSASDGTSTEFIEISWSTVENAKSYNIYYGFSKEDEPRFLYTGEDAGQSTMGVRAAYEGSNTRIFFWVTAVNDNGESPYSVPNAGFIEDQNEQDADEDGVGDFFDTDDDNDGMPDAYEETQGMDPLTNDASGDQDGDGKTNLEEYLALPRATQYLQTTSSSANVTSIHVINSSTSSQEFVGSLFDRSGNQLGQGALPLGSSVNANGRLILNSETLESIFDSPPWKGPAMLEVIGTDDFDLMAMLISPSGLVSNSNCVREDRVLNIEGFDSTNMTYVRLINTENQDTGEIIGTLYDTEGNVIGSADSVLAVNLGAHEQVWVNRNDLAGAVGVQWNGEALLEVNQIAGLKLLNLNYITDEETFFNFSCFEDNTSGTVYLQTTSTSQNVSFTHLVNTSDTAQQLTGTLYRKDGSQLGEANQPLHGSTIAPKGRVVISSSDIEAAFNISPWSGPAMLEVQGSDSFALMTKLTSPSGLISNTNCVRQDQVHNIGGFDKTDMTYVRFINTGDTTLTDIRGSLHNAAGDVIGAENPILLESLAPKSHVFRNRDQLSSLVGDTWNGTASLKIANPSEDLRLLNLNFINNETFFNFSCYETGQ